ncbi:MAG TPA: thioredoxin domain-containing protein, partial [Streptosporangiaceae bacterium]
MANRLKDATSPYLLQHADNPVDWWPWSDDAFDEARRRDVPVLLSVGYAACHWCHVMAHESFEDAGIARLMNDRLVSIKVDREERPDVDDVYMTATQAMTGQGGWPMTVFMTPDREPFYCGTYFPRENFRRLIDAVTNAWTSERVQLQEQATQIAATLAGNAAATAKALRENAGPLAALEDLEEGAAHRALAELTDAAVTGLADDFDPAHAGFGGAPKFPPSMACEFLLRHHERTADPRARQLAEQTLEAMARGGMYDQLGGGFARYSVDAAWVVPHFEKMLYDNALLARVYAHLWRRTGSELGRRVAEETCDWMVRELRTPQGGLAASLDADSEGEEGRFYVWSPAELAAAVGPEDGAYAAGVLGVGDPGTFEHGRSVLQRRADPADPERFAAVRAALAQAREHRPRPGRDDKVVAAWNGLAIAALAETGLLLGRDDLVEAATASAALLADVHLSGGRLARTSRDGAAGPGAGVLDDYGCVAEGFLVLSGVTG